MNYLYLSISNLKIIFLDKNKVIDEVVACLFISLANKIVNDLIFHYKKILLILIPDLIEVQYMDCIL